MDNTRKNCPALFMLPYCINAFYNFNIVEVMVDKEAFLINF